MFDAFFQFTFATPLMLTAIHAGHDIREELVDNLFISEEDMMREEDTFTEYITDGFTDKIIVETSRFEVELNRPRERAIYKTPEDCWGLKVWKKPLTKKEINESLQKYDEFYRRLKLIVQEMIDTFGYAIVLDIHSYNHNRLGDGQPFDSVEENPQIILGTSNMPRKYFKAVELIQELFKQNMYQGAPLDCRIDVKYPGGTLPRFLHETFPDKVFCLAIEFKKSFMNEWTGELYEDKFEELIEAFRKVAPVVDLIVDPLMQIVNKEISGKALLSKSKPNKK
ncbi:MAG: N-formylglutamate amidohydrolase [Candidatus Cloacimonadales bacterium]